MRCNVCHHPYTACHVETPRYLATDDERKSGACRDCKACHPPEDATFREGVKSGAVPA